MSSLGFYKSKKKTLPIGWRFAKLGRICRVFAGSSAPQGKEDFDPSGPFFFRVSDLGRFGRTNNLTESQDKLSQKALEDYQFVLARKGTVLFPKSGAAITTNNRALLGTDGYIVSHLMALEPTEVVYPDWIYYALCQIDMMKYSDNTGYPSLKKTVVEKIEIPLPPLPEQNRIAAILKEQMSSVERARKAAEARLEAVKTLPSSYVKSIFENPEAKQWPKKRLIEICKTKGQYGTSAKSNGNEVGLPILGMSHIYEGRIRWENVANIELGPEDCEKYLLKQGDLLFNRTNSAELVGKTAVYNLDRPAVFASYLIRFRIREDVSDPRFVSTYINSRMGREFIERKMARAIGQVNISASNMHEMLIPTPDLSYQRRLSDMLDEKIETTDAMRQTLRDELETINSLPASLLHRAFNGEL